MTTIPTDTKLLDDLQRKVKRHGKLVVSYSDEDGYALSTVGLHTLEMTVAEPVKTLREALVKKPR